ncbi:hypothetical protein B0H66DRAFT_488143 [Apodospora peruviana]|uniref:Rhodopsin domain-containing protein n=1 Tax=Apodospora peruviana TaxID=516989 RepID=A0AAE0IQD0_9PEZI|nr:hypothetical protein B0H66DRAFT_488143 [Apodospora peruviana]
MFILPRNQMQGLPTDDNLSPSEKSDSYAAKILATCWTLEVLSGIMLGLRIYCKHKRSRRLWWDDYILITAWTFQTVDVPLITIKVVRLGEGQHVWNLDRAVLPALALTGNVSGTLSIVATMLSKTSFGVTLLRLSASRIMAHTIWFLLVTMNVFLGLSAVFIWAQCTPVAKNWRPDLEGWCWDVGINAKYGLFSGVYSAFVDFALSFLPSYLIWNLTMELKEKMGVVVAMSMGVFAGLGAIAKVLQLHNLSRGDFSYYESELVIWGTVESAVTIMAASVPFLRVLIVDHGSIAGARSLVKSARVVPKDSDREQGDEQELVNSI